MMELESHPDFTRFDGRCPVCLGTGSYQYHGERHECPDDDFGHVALRLFKLYCLANLPLEYQQLDWSDYPYVDVAEEADRYLDRFDTVRLHGLGWEITGLKRGVGKSWLSAHLLKSVLLRGHSGWWIQFSELKSVHEREGADKTWVTRKMMESEMLVIDDIIVPKSERMRDFFEDKLEEVIRHRTTRNLPTVTSTNMVEEEMERHFPRVYSLMSAKQIRVELEGSDHRHEVWRENHELLLNGETRPITLA